MGSAPCQGPSSFNGDAGKGVMARTEHKKNPFKISWNPYEKLLFYPFFYPNA